MSPYLKALARFRNKIDFEISKQSNAINDVIEWLRFANDSGNNIAFPTIIEAEEK